MVRRPFCVPPAGLPALPDGGSHTADRTPIAVTASFGVTASVDESPLDAPEILRLADAALYRAKERGRNRTELVRPEDLVVRATDFPGTVEQKTTTR